MKKIFTVILVGLMLITSSVTWISTAYADPETTNPEPFPLNEDYVGVARIDAGVSFSGGNVVCSGTLRVRLDYSVIVTMKLKKDGNVVSTWTYYGESGERMNFSETYDAAYGSTYQVVLSVKVYDSDENYITTITYNSTPLTYY